MLPRIVPTGRAAGYARQRVIKRVPKIVKAKRPAAKTNNAANQSPAAAPKEWKFTGWVSTKRDIKAAVDECVQNIRPKFGDVRPDVCFVFSSHQSDDKLRRIPALVKNALKPRALFGSSSFGVFGAGGAMPQGQEVANKQALSIVAATMPDVEIYPFHLRTPSLPSFPPEFDWATHTLPKRKNGGAADDDEISSAMFVITDGFDFREDELLQRLDFAFPSCPKFGGLASSRNVRLFVNDKAYPEGAAGLLVHGKFRLDQIKAESFRPIGRSYTVSEVTPYSEKDFETFLTSVGAEDEGEEGGDDAEHDDDSKPSFTYASDGDDESEGSDDDEEAEDLSSVIHAISGRTVYDVVQELASDLSSRDKSRFLSGQFLVGVDPRVPSSSETKPRPPSVFVARNVKEMEVDSESNEGGYLTLYENVPQGKHIQFCLKDRNKGLADLRAQLARLNLPPVPAAVAATVPPAPLCPLTQQRAGTSEVGMLGFSSIGRSLYAKDAAAQIELAHEGVFPLAGRTPLDLVADQLVADMHATADTTEVQSFIEGELAPSLDRPAAATASGNNFAAGPTTAVEGRHNDDDWMAQLDETTTTPTTQQQKTERKNEYDDDIVSYSQKAKKPQQPEESASSRQQLEAFFDDDDDDDDLETRRMKKVEEEEEEDSSATDASVIAESFGSRVTFGGMFCKGEFFTTDTRQEHEDGGSTNNNNNNNTDDDDDERSTLLHGYINSIAVIMPPKSYHQHPKEK